MNDLLKNPAAWVALLCLAAFVVGLNLTLIGLARGDRNVREEASKWGKALRGGVDGRQQAEAQMDELHAAVEQLKRGAGRK
jgi:hypothetical protein